MRLATFTWLVEEVEDLIEEIVVEVVTVSEAAHGVPIVVLLIIRDARHRATHLVSALIHHIPQATLHQIDHHLMALLVILQDSTTTEDSIIRGLALTEIESATLLDLWTERTTDYGGMIHHLGLPLNARELEVLRLEAPVARFPCAEAHSPNKEKDATVALHTRTEGVFLAAGATDEDHLVEDVIAVEEKTAVAPIFPQLADHGLLGVVEDIGIPPIDVLDRPVATGDEPSKPHKHPYTRLDDRSISPHPNQIHDESRMDRSDEGLDHMRDNFANHGKRGSKLPNKQGRRHPPFQHDSRPYPTSPRFTPNSHPGSPPKSPHSGGRGERHRNPDSGPGPSSPYQQDNQYSHKTYSGQPYKMRGERYGDLANRHPPSKLDEQTYRGGHPGHRGNHTANGQGRRFSVSSRSQNNGSPQRGGRGHFNSAQWTTSRSDGPSGRQSSRPSSPYENQTTLNHPSNFVDPGSPHGSEKIKRLRNPDRDDHEDDRSSILSGGVDQAKPEQAASATRESDNTIPADKKGRFSFAFKTKTPQAPAPKPVPDLAQRMQIRDPPPRAPAPDPPTPRNRLTNGPMPKFKPDPPSRFDRRERDRGRDRDRRDDRRHPRDSRDNRDARDFRDSRDKRDDRRFDQRRDRRGRGDRRPDFNPRDMSPIESLREQFREPREIPPPTPPKRTKVLTRYKPRPVIPQEFAQADSVYYRKPGNESVIGAGTYGKVFKGIHVFTQRKVALKKIRMEGEKDGFPVTAVREVKLLQHLRNHNVVSLLEVMVEHNECFMVFEYLSHDLTGLINHPNFNLTLAHKKNLAQQMFEGLSYLHHRGVLHRDIKAANILISNQGLLKFADFGLARFFSKSRPLDYTNRVITICAACVCMEMFTKKAVFPGEGGELSQLDKLFNCLGTPAKSEWPDFVEMPWFQLMRPTERKKRIFEEVYREVLTPQALDMISTVFQYDPAKRPTAEEVLQHPYFVAEEPLPQQPTELEHMEGDWHEFESKALRKEARRAEQQTQKDREKRKAGPPTDRDPKRSRQGGSEHS
ncbi:hypothetical protein N7468_008239 [Penicillium chermesinum]|uniref:cyclin-dependent kinase n=1 Tax=Penicillium chermesinum TaxID=63820 RepID=A0A9W9TI39_9EURO|nr:uncharacterized protein N7468_008239 [Penicillium chermesinum]KAJ5223697.1 hypothetical protein N7468_008239 [Penicillium chermesinum]